jgi:hypothetical protein
MLAATPVIACTRQKACRTFLTEWYRVACDRREICRTRKGGSCYLAESVSVVGFQWVRLSWKKKEGWGLSMRRELLLTRFDRIGVKLQSASEISVLRYAVMLPVG